MTRVVLLAGAALLAAALLLPAGGHGAPPAPEPAALPMLGAADGQTIMMGAAPQSGQAGETWAYRPLPLDVGPPTVGGHALAFGPVADARSPNSQLAFLRYTDATGWQVAQTPLDESGHPYRGPLPNKLSARITPHGGGVLVGRDLTRPADQQAVVLARDPGGAFRVLPTPPAAVLLAGEAVAGDRGTGAVADAAVEENGKTGAFVAPQGLDAEPAVLHWDGTTWTREPVDVPTGSETHFSVLAIDATDATNAWLLARPDPALGLGIVLYHRAGDGAWHRADLGSSFWSQAGADGVQALSGAAQPLTVTTQGVWIDARLHVTAGDVDSTLFYDIAQGKLTGTWCDDATACDHTLGASLSTQQGYRSFAWAGPGFGTRVITNPLAAGGSEDTNRGTWLRLEGDSFARVPGAGGNFRPSGAFADDHDGWLEGPVQIGPVAAPQHLTAQPVALRAPLTSIATAPGQPAGATTSGALAVGADGAVARYTPGRGWVPEFLLTDSGAVSHPTLRGVAWPEPGVAHAVGDDGAMWQWRADTGLWEKDPAAPIGIIANMLGIAFDPGNPARGYAVGKQGTLLHYDKTFTQDPLPTGFANANFTSVAFAGHQALVAAGTDVLENEGSGWHVDQGLHGLLATLPSGDRSLITVAGLPDGGALAAGRDIVLERDTASSPWRFSDQPLPGSTVVAAGLVRQGPRVSATVSVVPDLSYPVPDILPPPDPNVPPPLIPAFPLPGDGYLLTETTTGWRDEERSAFAGSGLDRPVKADPVYALLLDPSGDGWAVGGWSGETDAAGRGVAAGGAVAGAIRDRVQTAGIYRYSPGAPPAAAASVTAAPIATPVGPARLAIGGHAECEQPCADLADEGLGPDRTLTATLAAVAKLHGQEGGPRAFLYTGGRLRPAGNQPEPAAEAQRFAALLGSQSALPTFAAASQADTAGGGGAYASAFASFGAPFGTGSAPAGVTPVALPGDPAPSGGARTHYAFDSAGSGGTVRVVVIDNSAGSLAASDPNQNPAQPQAPWLAAVLADARTKAIPAIVVGSRDLNPRFHPSLNVASDGDAEAQILVQGGASAYFYERPEENRVTAIPAGGATTIPEFGTGTLGYRSPVSGAITQDVPDSLFGDAGYLLTEIDAAHRDATTNRAPVHVRLIPVITDVSLDAIDGTLVRRSRVALFAGLGRRPVAGDRWGPVSADGTPDPPGGDPYTAFPPGLCRIAGCSTRITPEYSFDSSENDIGDFVATDPNTSNLRKPLQDSKGKVITSATSGLFCAFNAGTTTVTISAGGLAYSTPVTVLGGSVQQPCGTRPLNPKRFTKRSPSPAPVSPPPPGPAPAPAAAPPVPPPPAATPTPHHPVAKPHVVKPIVPAAILPTPVPPKITTPGRVPGTPPPGNPAGARPTPPGGALARVYQVEEKREEELAPEQSQAFSRYNPDEHIPIAPFEYGAIVLAAIAGATIRRSVRGGRPRPVPARASARNQPPNPRRRP